MWGDILKQNQVTFYSTVFITIFAVLALLSSCRWNAPIPTSTQVPTLTVISDTDLLDQSWLLDEPCKAPCWYELELEHSTQQEAEEAILSLPFIEPSHDPYSIGLRISGNKEEELIYFDCVEPQGVPCAILGFVNSVLVEIMIVPNFHITFADVVEKIGAPDVMRAEPVAPSATECQVSLIWADRQMSIAYWESKRGSNRDLCQIVRKDQKPPLDLIVYFVSYKVLNEDDISLSKVIYPWNGFIEP
jgi:hypothetical protein